MRRWLAFGTIALAAHVAAIVAVRAHPVTAAPASEVARGEETAIEVAETPEELPPSLPDVPRATEPVTATQHATPGARVATREAEPATGPAAEGPTEPAAAPPSASSGGWTFDPRKPEDITSSAFVARAVRGPLDPSEPSGPPTGVSRTGGVAEGLDAHDASIGLGRGGLVVTALEAAAAGDSAPFEGKATFDIAIDSSGHVSVSLLNASTAAPQWARLGEVTRAAIDPSRLRIPPGARGWHVVADVEAKVQYPNGVDPKKLGTHVETSGGRLVENKERAEAHEPPLVFEKLPGVTLAHAGKVCTVRITIGLTPIPISGGCDPSNIGARPMRVVHGHVVSEGRL
jgi:hypothetical protein